MQSKSLKGLNSKQRVRFIAFMRAKGLNVTKLAQLLVLKGVIQQKTGTYYTYETLRTLISKWSRGNDKLALSVVRGLEDVLGVTLVNIIKPAQKTLSDVQTDLIDMVLSLDAESFSNLLLTRSMTDAPLEGQRLFLYTVIKGLPQDDIKHLVHYTQQKMHI